MGIFPEIGIWDVVVLYILGEAVTSTYFRDQRLKGEEGCSIGVSLSLFRPCLGHTRCA
jgi:hypothetical protein